MKLLIKDATKVIEGELFISDILRVNKRIEKITENISDSNSNCKVVNAEGLLLMLGSIDNQVHF